MTERPPPLTPDWFAAHRARLDHWRHDAYQLILDDLDQIRDQINELINQRADTPTSGPPPAAPLPRPRPTRSKPSSATPQSPQPPTTA